LSGKYLTLSTARWCRTPSEMGCAINDAWTVSALSQHQQ
jgi:hypothetical protein